MLVVIGKGSGITSLPGRCPRKFNSFATVMHDLAVKFVQEVSTSTARFFAAEPLLIFGLAKPFWGLAKAFWVASMIVHPEL